MDTINALLTMVLLGGILGVCMLVIQHNTTLWKNPIAIVVGALAFTWVLQQGLLIYYQNDWFMKTMMGGTLAFMGFLLWMCGQAKQSHFETFEERMAKGEPFKPVSDAKMQELFNFEQVQDDDDEEDE